jgi:hypothetical protein
MRSKPTVSTFYRRGIAISEALFALAVMAVTCSVAYQQVSGLHRDSNSVSLGSDVKMLNKSVATYLENGGTIPSGTSGDTLLAKMKKTAAESKEGTFAGLKGPFVDLRLKGIASPSGSTASRIVWNSSTRRFAVSQEGTGWSSLAFDEQEAQADHGTEVRTLLHNFSQENCWVWDYAESGTARQRPNRIPQSTPGVAQLPLTDDPVPLAAPAITPLSGTFDHHAFPLSLSMSNPNAASVSNLLYQINGGAWLAWQGGSAPVAKSLTTTVAAFAQAREMSAYSDSAIVTETYITYFMRGQSGGVFVNQSGDNQFFYNLSSSGAQLSWGKAEAAGQSASSLELIPGTVFEAGAGESFELGKLHYVNGVTRAGTNARTASIRVDLGLSVPAGSTVSVDIPVRMLNTIHYPGTPASDYVDYLWVPQYTAVTQPVTILDRQFAISILAQANSAAVEGTEIKVPINENASADVTLVATIAAL